MVNFKKNTDKFMTQRAIACVDKKAKIVHQDIMITSLYNFDPIKPHFYIVKLGFTGVYIIFLISAQKHILLVFVRTASVRQV